MAGFFVTMVAASSAWADQTAATNATNVAQTSMAAPVGTLAATASPAIGQVASVVQVVDPREQASDDGDRAANVERCRPAAEREPSLIPLAP